MTMYFSKSQVQCGVQFGLKFTFATSHKFLNRKIFKTPPQKKNPDFVKIFVLSVPANEHFMKENLARHFFVFISCTVECCDEKTVENISIPTVEYFIAHERVINGTRTLKGAWDI